MFVHVENEVDEGADEFHGGGLSLPGR
jgi:hypothetical protein